MIKNYLKTTFRSFKKNKTFVLINTIGLGLSIACCIVAFINYDYATSYDENVEGQDKIFRVNMERTFNGETTKYGVAPIPLAAQVRQNFSEVNNTVLYIRNYNNFKIEADVFSSGIVYSDPSFVEVFSVDMIEGSANSLNDESNILISDEVSIKYFGTLQSVGKQITMVLPEKTVDYFVSGVFKKFESNSSFDFDALTRTENYFKAYPEFSEDDWSRYSTLFLQIENKGDIDRVTTRLQDYIELQNKAREDLKADKFYLDPFVDIAMRSESEEINAHWLRSALPIAAVYAPWFMAIVILLIACFNFTNTSIAISSRRLKEIGIRKVLGSVRQQLIIQFLTENIVLCLFGLIAGLIFAEFLVPAYSNMWAFLDLKLNYLENLDFLLFLLGILVFTGILAGSYPAFYISGFQPTAILKGNAKFSGTNYFTRALLFFQYAACILALVMGFAFVDNARYQKEMDLGYDTEGLIFHRLSNSSEVEKYRNAMLQNPQVSTITLSEHHLYSNIYNDPIKYDTAEAETDVMNVSYDYLEVMGIELIEGRPFNKDSETDMRESVIVNETFVKEFKWDEPLGKRLVYRDTVQLYVVGVVKDFYTSAFWVPISPLMFRLGDKKDYTHIIVKTLPGKIEEVEKSMESEFKALFPNYIYNGRLMDSEKEESLMINTNIIKMFVFLALLALILTGIGLYSLVSLNILRRMKEIGVRKVLGASVLHIVNKLNKEFIIILVLSALVGIPLGYYASVVLLEMIFNYFQVPTIITMLTAFIIMFVMSIATLGGKVIKAALANPVNALKSE